MYRLQKYQGTTNNLDIKPKRYFADCDKEDEDNLDRVLFTSFGEQ
jgi:hypothetical protein